MGGPGRKALCNGTHRARKGLAVRRESLIACAQDKVTASGGSGAAPGQRCFLMPGLHQPAKGGELAGFRIK